MRTHLLSLLFLFPLQRSEDEAPDGLFTFYRRPNVKYYKVRGAHKEEGEGGTVSVASCSRVL